MNVAVIHARYTATPTNRVSDKVLNLSLLLILLQVLDAVLTTIGLDMKGGIVGEGNGVLRYSMGMIGIVPTLILAKTAAVGFIAALSVLSTQVRWIETAMAALVALYLCAAIIPWTAIIVLGGMP